MDKTTWLEERQKGIGGSDAAAVCGMSPWKSAYQVYQEKIGTIVPQEDNPAMFWGRTLEPVIRQRYADVTGKTVTVPKGILTHPTRNFMLANLDGIIPNDRVVEIKTARSDKDWGEEGSNEIPDPYMLQIQHYLIITALPVADVAVLFHGQDFRIYEVPEDKELQELMVDKEAVFWDMVQRQLPPDPVTFSDIKQKWGGISKSIELQATPEITKMVEQLHGLKDLKKKEDELKARIMAFMQVADTLIHPINQKPLVTWKLGSPTKRLDITSLKSEQTDIYNQFLKEGIPSRRFLIK